MAISESVENSQQVIRCDLGHLFLDHQNPRFGGLQEVNSSQAQILDHIVDKFGVNDVLSSLAVNGYFEAEPLVGRRVPDSDDIIVVEGNRRLAACLMLTQEQRAVNQVEHSRDFRKTWQAHGCPLVNPLPTITFDPDKEDRSILSYSGVRHIASALPWDSYAKAAWIAQVVEQDKISIAEVAKMIGDRHRTVNKMREGYCLIKQLTETGRFDQKNSVRRGRGSVTDYPFSWVYTILGYASVRNFLELDSGEADISALKEKSLDNAELVVSCMFGDKSKGRNAAIDDSRQLGALAEALADKEKVGLLKQGEVLSDINLMTQPLDRRLADGLATIGNELRDLINSLSEHPISSDSAAELLPRYTKNRRLTNDLDKRLKEIAFDDEDDD